MDKNAAKILLISDFLSQHRDDIEPFEYDYLRRHIGSLDKNFIEKSRCVAKILFTESQSIGSFIIFNA